MRTSFLTLLLCLSSGSTGFAQDWAPAMFDHASHDFGVVARGAKVQHRFTLENIFLEDMRISSVQSSCTCTAVKFSTDPLKTYETAEIVATVDTRKFLGRKESTLRVKLAEPFPAEVQLHVYCYIRSDVVIEPGEVQFGSVEQGQTATRKVTVSYAGRSDWKIMDVQSTWPHLKATVQEVQRTTGTVVYDLWVTLNEDAPVGYVRDHLIVLTNDRNPDAARVPLAVEGVVVSAVSAGPSPLPLGVVQAGQAVTRNLVVRGKTPFRILDVSGPDERFKFDVPKTAAPLQLIPVTFTAGNTPGKVGGAIHIQTDLKGSSVLDVMVDGMVLPGNSEPPPEKPAETGDGGQVKRDGASDWQPIAE